MCAPKEDYFVRGPCLDKNNDLCKAQLLRALAKLIAESLFCFWPDPMQSCFQRDCDNKPIVLNFTDSSDILEIEVISKVPQILRKNVCFYNFDCFARGKTLSNVLAYLKAHEIPFDECRIVLKMQI